MSTPPDRPSDSQAATQPSTAASNTAGTSVSAAQAGSSTAGRHRATSQIKGTSSRWVGVGAIAAVVAGLLSFLLGLTVIFRSTYFPALTNYLYRTPNAQAWGWVLAVLGILLVAAGASHLLGFAWARVAGIGLTSMLAIASFVLLAHTQWVGVILLVLCVLVIWGLINLGANGIGADSQPDSSAESSPAQSASVRT